MGSKLIRMLCANNEDHMQITAQPFLVECILGFGEPVPSVIFLIFQFRPDTTHLPGAERNKLCFASACQDGNL